MDCACAHQSAAAPWIEGMPHDHLGPQLRGFRDGERRNDSLVPMRSVARSMTDAQIEEVARFHARTAPGGG